MESQKNADGSNSSGSTVKELVMDYGLWRESQRSLFLHYRDEQLWLKLKHMNVHLL